MAFTGNGLENIRLVNQAVQIIVDRAASNEGMGWYSTVPGGGGAGGFTSGGGFFLNSIRPSTKPEGSCQWTAITLLSNSRLLHDQAGMGGQGLPGISLARRFHLRQD
jgi:hypothetical protein